MSIHYLKSMYNFLPFQTFFDFLIRLGDVHFFILQSATGLLFSNVIEGEAFPSGLPERFGL
jgi:hypothetical protein